MKSSLRLPKGVKLVNPSTVMLKCETCGASWSPNLLPGGKLPRNSRNCPNGCTTKKGTINLEDWYTNEEARQRLSENSRREIDKNYPRTLARYGKIESLDIGARGKLYLKKDVDAYIVDTKPGKKASKQPEKPAA